MPSKISLEEIKQTIWLSIRRGSDDECWPWIGRRDPNGYGRIDYGGRPRLAHRFVFLFVNGTEPPAVCHSCDNPWCCNPSHLWAGTQQDNIKDMIDKGRQGIPKPRYGQAVNTCKLTPEQAIEVFLSTDRQRDVAKRYGISQTAVGYIKRGRNWAHVTKSLSR